MINKKIKILFFVILLLISSSLVSSKIESQELSYVYNKVPTALMIGSKICFDAQENEICAPIIGYTIDGANNEITTLDFEITTKEDIPMSGKACILQELGTKTWENAMNSLTNYCSRFSSVNNKIVFSINSPANENIHLILIPDSGSGESDIISGNIEVQGIAPLPIPTPEPTPIIPEPEIEKTEISKCYVESIEFDKSESNVNTPVEIILKTSQCNNSVVKITIKKNSLTSNSVVSEKQALITGSIIRTFWIPKEIGEYYVETLSKNQLKSSTIIIKEFDKQDFFEDKEFYKIVDEIHKISKVSNEQALDMCNRLGTQLEKDVCIEDLAVYAGKKSYCAKIEEKKRKESCYSAFALQGDISSCIHSDNKGMCLMLSLFAKSSNVTLKPKDKYEGVIAIPEVQTKKISIPVVIIMLIAVFIILYFGFIRKSKKK